MLIAISTFVLGLLVYGIINRRNRKVHIPVMFAAFIIDLLLVLYIEFNSQAIEHVVSESISGLLAFHVTVSVMMLILYIVLIVLGLKILKATPNAQLWHRRLSYLFVVCRLANYVTSFWVT